MISTISRRLAKKINDNYPESNKDILEYSLNIVINPTLTVILTLIISYFTERTIEAVISMIGFAVLRAFSGGIHIRSSELCIIVSTLLFTSISILNGLFADNVMTMTTIALVLSILFAPSRIEGQTRIQPKYYLILKIVSIVIISINYILSSSTLALTFLVQSLLLIKIVKGGEKE